MVENPTLLGEGASMMFVYVCRCICRFEFKRSMFVNLFEKFQLTDTPVAAYICKVVLDTCLITLMATFNQFFVESINL